jgi:hypothetical protein
MWGKIPWTCVYKAAKMRNSSLARREEAGKAGADPVERTSSELNHSPSGNLVPSRDSEREQQEPALEPGADKSEKGASPRSADELPTNASGLRAIPPQVVFPRWWIELIRDQLVSMGKLPTGPLGDWAFLFREILSDALEEQEASSVSRPNGETT